MAGIGMYGVYCAACKKEDGVTVGYEGGIQQPGRAIEATFTPNTPSDNPLYSNNSAGENDSSSGSGGTLSVTMDRLTREAAAALFGMKLETVTVNVGNKTVEGTALKRFGTEQSAPVGVAYIRSHQIDNNREHHEVVFYRSVTFPIPEEVARTMEEAIEWQTVTLEGKVDGLEGDGTTPWFESVEFPTQEAALEYIYSKLRGTAPEEVV